MDIVRNELLWYIKIVFTPRFDVIQRPYAWEARFWCVRYNTGF